MLRSTDIPLEPAPGYRIEESSGDSYARDIERHLDAASDALAMAILSLDSLGHESKSEKHSRAAKVRYQMVEAATALSKAKVFKPGIHTYSVPAVMASITDVDAELTRLHQLCSILMWRNNVHLPARKRAKPLSPRDEAQLRRMLDSLKLNAKLGHATRYKWLGFAAVIAAASPLLGPQFLALGLAAAIGAGWQLLRGPKLTALPES